jgi:hypothetical protein
MVAELRGGHVGAVLALEFTGIRSAVYLLYSYKSTHFDTCLRGARALEF